MPRGYSPALPGCPVTHVDLGNGEREICWRTHCRSDDASVPAAWFGLWAPAAASGFQWPVGVAGRLAENTVFDDRRLKSETKHYIKDGVKN